MIRRHAHEFSRSLFSVLLLFYSSSAVAIVGDYLPDFFHPPSSCVVQFFQAGTKRSLGICSGDIVSGKQFLSTAHCYDDHPSQKAKIICANGVVREVVSKVFHPSYKKSKDASHDVVILSVDDDFGIRPLPLALSERAIEEHVAGGGCAIFGFGLDANNRAGAIHGVPMQNLLPQKIQELGKKVKNKERALGPRNLARLGDSGGGLLCLDSKNHWIRVGTTTKAHPIVSIVELLSPNLGWLRSVLDLSHITMDQNFELENLFARIQSALKFSREIHAALPDPSVTHADKRTAIDQLNDRLTALKSRYAALAAERNDDRVRTEARLVGDETRQAYTEATQLWTKMEGAWGETSTLRLGEVYSMLPRSWIKLPGRLMLFDPRDSRKRMRFRLTETPHRSFSWVRGEVSIGAGRTEVRVRKGDLHRAMRSSRGKALTSRGGTSSAAPDSQHEGKTAPPHDQHKTPTPKSDPGGQILFPNEERRFRFNDDLRVYPNSGFITYRNGTLGLVKLTWMTGERELLSNQNEEKTRNYVYDSKTSYSGQILTFREVGHDRVPGRRDAERLVRQDLLTGKKSAFTPWVDLTLEHEVSHDDRFVVYRNYGQLFLAPLNGSSRTKPTALTKKMDEIVNYSHITISHDDQSVIFTSDYQGPIPALEAPVYDWRTDVREVLSTEKPQPIAESQIVAGKPFGNDRPVQSIVRSKYRAYRLFRLDLKTMKITLLINPTYTYTDWAFHPQISHDGKYVVYRDKKGAIQKLDLKSKRRTRLTPDYTATTVYGLSFDDRFIPYSFDKDAPARKIGETLIGTSIHRLDLNTGESEIVIDGVGNIYRAARDFFR